MSTPKITVQQVEQFLQDTQQQFKKSTGAKYAALTVHLDGTSGLPEWAVHTGENLESPNRGRDLYKVLAKEADAIRPMRRAAALREKADELRREAEQLEPTPIYPGDGWRLLNDGEPLRAGDGFLSPDHNGHWLDYACRPDIFKGGGTEGTWYFCPRADYAHTWPWRRKIEAVTGEATIPNHTVQEVA